MQSHKQDNAQLICPCMEIASTVLISTSGVLHLASAYKLQIVLAQDIT
jgi:hypothetical protein